jgi:putative ABC transport system permease protein
MKMNVALGRDFSRSFATDSSAVIINETLAKKLGWDDPLNKKITGFGSSGPFDLTVIGVVSDFHFRSLHDVIEPSLMFIGNRNNRFLNVRLAPGDYRETLNTIEAKWQELNTSLPFDYYFLDQDFDRLYRTEERAGELFLYFTLIAIIVACLGLFGLASFNAEQRKKEIGIRKALGASVQRIVLMLSKKFTGLVLLANILAWPVAFYFMQEWLNQFAYRLHLWDTWWVFLLSALFALLIALLTVSYQALKAALINPVEAIKYE